MMIILKETMAAKDAMIDYLEHEFNEREKEIKNMMDGDKAQQVADERIRDLENKIREMEALMKGLTEELLDLKSIVMKIHTKEEERRAVVPMPPRASAPPAPVRPRSAVPPMQPQRQAQQSEVKDARELELIMQPDGTLKPERRSQSDYIVATPRYNATMGGKGKGKGKAEEEKKPQGALIEAIEEDPEKKKKK
jgi:hypothetical protein